MVYQNNNNNSNSGNIGSDSLVLLFVKCLVVAVRLLQTMMLSRILTKEEYGTYSQALLVISLFAPILSLGLESAVNYFFNRSEDDAERRKCIATIFTMSLVMGSVGAIALLFSRDLIGEYYHNAGVTALMGYIAIRPCLQNLASIYQNLYISSGLSKAVAIRNLMVSLAQVGAIAFAAVWTNDLALLFALLMTLDFLQVLVLSIYYRRRRFPVRIQQASGHLVMPILAYAVPLLLASSVGALSANLGRLLVSGLMSTGEFAVYTNMSQELPFSFVISSFTAVVTPAAVKLLTTRSMDRFRMLWGDYVELGYLVTWPLCAAAFAAAPQAIEFLYSAAYLSDEGVAVFRIFLFNCAMRFTYFGLVPTAMGQSRVVLVYSSLGLAISLPLTLFLFGVLGMKGAALASVISTVAPGIPYFRRSSRLTGIPVSDVFRFRRCALLLIEMGALGAIVWGVNLLINFGPLLGCLLSFAVICGGCYLLNLRELVRLVRSMNAA